MGQNEYKVIKSGMAVLLSINLSTIRITLIWNGMAYQKRKKTMYVSISEG